MKKFLLKIVLGLNLIAAICLAGSYISVYIPPDKVWLSAIFGLTYPIFLWINLGFVVFWIFVRFRYSFISIVAVLLGWVFLTRYFQFVNKSSHEKGIKVVSYNVKHFEENGTRQAKAVADSIILFLKSEAPDLICLQEMRLMSNRVFNLQQFINEFDFAEHYQYARTAYQGGIVTMTRYPIAKMGEIRFENSGNMAIFTDIVIGADTVRVFNLHLQSFQIDPNNYSVIESPDITEEADIRQIREMGSKFKRASRMRAEQARIINKNIEWSPYPVIVCGDFNDTPFSYTYRQVRGDLKDAFLESGSGIGQTYIGKLPSYRIDYVLHSDRFRAANFRSFPFRFSDHLPVSCTLYKD